MLAIDVQEFRDITIIVFTIAGTVLFVLASLASILAVIALVLAIRTVNGLRSRLQPTLDGLRDTVDGLRGTATFVSNTAVSPIIRTYSMYAGARRFLGVMAGTLRRGRRP